MSDASCLRRLGTTPHTVRHHQVRYKSYEKTLWSLHINFQNQKIQEPNIEELYYSLSKDSFGYINASTLCSLATSFPLYTVAAVLTALITPLLNDVTLYGLSYLSSIVSYLSSCYPELTPPLCSVL